MKKTFLAIALAAAVTPFTFAKGPQANPPANDTQTQAPAKKKAKKARKHHKKTGETTTNSAAPQK